MPRLVKIADVLTMDKGEILPYTRGRVTKVLDQIAGTKTDGSGDQYSFQKIFIKDGEAEIMVKVWDRDAIPANMVGKQLHVYSTSSNNKMQGLKIDDETYKGKTSKYIKATPSAGIDLAGPEGSEAPAEAPQDTPEPAKAQATAQAQATKPAQASKSATAAQATPATATAEAKPGTLEAIAKVKKDVFKRMNLHMICRVMIEEEAKQLREQRGINLTADEIQSYTSSLFISADRDKLHWDLPAKTLDVKLKDDSAH